MCDYDTSQGDRCEQQYLLRPAQSMSLQLLPRHDFYQSLDHIPDTLTYSHLIPSEFFVKKPKSSILQLQHRHLCRQMLHPTNPDPRGHTVIDPMITMSQTVPVFICNMLAPVQYICIHAITDELLHGFTAVYVQSETRQGFQPKLRCHCKPFCKVLHKVVSD